MKAGPEPSHLEASETAAETNSELDCDPRLDDHRPSRQWRTRWREDSSNRHSMTFERDIMEIATRSRSLHGLAITSGTRECRARPRREKERSDAPNGIRADRPEMRLKRGIAHRREYSPRRAREIAESALCASTNTLYCRRRRGPVRKPVSGLSRSRRLVTFEALSGGRVPPCSYHAISCCPLVRCPRIGLVVSWPGLFPTTTLESIFPPTPRLRGIEADKADQLSSLAAGGELEGSSA